eukprot:sb/3474699/
MVYRINFELAKSVEWPPNHPYRNGAPDIRGRSLMSGHAEGSVGTMWEWCVSRKLNRKWRGSALTCIPIPGHHFFWVLIKLCWSPITITRWRASRVAIFSRDTKSGLGRFSVLSPIYFQTFQHYFKQINLRLTEF